MSSSGSFSAHRRLQPNETASRQNKNREEEKGGKRRVGIPYQKFGDFSYYTEYSSDVNKKIIITPIASDIKSYHSGASERSIH